MTADQKAHFAIAEVKAAPSENPNGEFEIVMSTDAVDRDGEVISKGAFDPLPPSVPVHAFHDFNKPVGRAVPGYDGLGRLVGRGFFGSDAESQKVRQQVVDGLIGHTSVGFMAAERETLDGVQHVTRAELLEVSFVSVPSNRGALVLAAKTFITAEQYTDDTAEAKASKGDRLQTIHDLAVANGATCGKAAHPTDMATPGTPAAPTAGKSPVSAVTAARLLSARAALDL